MFRWGKSDTVRPENEGSLDAPSARSGRRKLRNTGLYKCCPEKRGNILYRCTRKSSNPTSVRVKLPPETQPTHDNHHLPLTEFCFFVFHALLHHQLFSASSSVRANFLVLFESLRAVFTLSVCRCNLPWTCFSRSKWPLVSSELLAPLLDAPDREPIHICTTWPHCLTLFNICLNLQKEITTWRAPTANI
ncbi:hypothetical protein SODALDRAFT_356861 [Sodiomyces alkalinus F11]|uniref:Uncharacterized protein n=1 Tax=Sodiomyces alkalinus (strain CBS 110278 / VKM F-3762 / F11) TaxID=1314773 RepID=A0A3N2Q276_SODAK|nr:hypothetical protein SODALDRAFT_356861 [Sodiomyces alkalinus F11]ROT40832.1 hypothetical protein SODALDRAFT_356861 [Sodiomyces alkalinus F11]